VGKAAIYAFLTAVVLALSVFGMPAHMVVGAVAHGLVYAWFRIAWVVLAAVFVYDVTVESGQFEILKQSIGNIADDCRLQVLLIAFAFGALLEGAGGGGAPVAVTGAMISDWASLRFKPRSCVWCQLGAGGFRRTGQSHPHAGGGHRPAGGGLQRDDRAHSSPDHAAAAVLAHSHHDDHGGDPGGMAGPAACGIYIRRNPSSSGHRTQMTPSLVDICGGSARCWYWPPVLRKGVEAENSTGVFPGEVQADRENKDTGPDVRPDFCGPWSPFLLPLRYSW